MGLLIDGRWHDQWYDTKKTEGKFKREPSQFHNEIQNQPNARFPPEKGRYHLYVSLACPWAHRTLIFRKLKKLEHHIDISIVHPHMLEHGWEFKTGMGATGDNLYGLNYLYEIYTKADKEYTGRVTVPVLWDKKEKTIVSNESAEIIRQFNHAFDHLTGDKQDFYPEELRAEIDAVNETIYNNVNNGVYKCGFATTQEAYEQAYYELFAVLDELESHLEQHNYLVGGRLTEADWRLFTTLIRFDAVYYGHFKANQQRIADYQALQNYLKSLYHHPGIRETVNFLHIKQHYYFSHKNINPTQIVPVGPKLDFDER
ncbi:glutathione S-transferase family protein [Legionella jordanis]|uniref:S-transferase n=1 Tax=Legionella jordanis TaxID=456 RepID=A0A0W0VE56_9GAMM|nr:glutathione S-transferase family protein [Legionella jordanis]KTD18400.1 S-transferase [Legionella jordanis]RMX05307.1 glutathione S-transferase family protein [Legionella jordanis]RMX20842.1 glutathione S-transferase family protein [Legionella jordanis]VEH13254.1 S-transferase [Legionella jordanis]HAT8713605.1 glutathione S-transferase family protein [Legionella jordanis]